MVCVEGARSAPPHGVYTHDCTANRKIPQAGESRVRTQIIVYVNIDYFPKLLEQLDVPYVIGDSFPHSPQLLSSTFHIFVHRFIHKYEGQGPRLVATGSRYVEPAVGWDRMPQP